MHDHGSSFLPRIMLRVFAHTSRKENGAHKPTTFTGGRDAILEEVEYTNIVIK